MFDAMLAAALKAIVVVPVVLGTLAICFLGTRMRRLAAGALGALVGAVIGWIVGEPWLAGAMMPWAIVAGAVLVSGLYAGDERAHGPLAGALLGAILAFLAGFDRLGIAVGIVAFGSAAFAAPRIAFAAASALIGAIGTVLAVAWGTGVATASILSFVPIAAVVGLAFAGAGYQYAWAIARPAVAAKVIPARPVVVPESAMLEPRVA